MARKTVWLLAGVLWCSAWLCAPVAQATSTNTAHAALLDFALWVARVAANEGAFVNRPEAALVWQTARSSAKTTEKRAAWLAKHSPRVHGSRPCKVGNCCWTPNLTRSDAMPDGIALGRHPLDVWNIRVAPIWRDTLRYVDWMVLGDRTSEDPCPITPKTWGCEADRKRALREGLYPIGCRGTLDDGFTYAKHCWQGSSGWACDKRFEPSVQTDGPGALWASYARR